MLSSCGDDTYESVIPEYQVNYSCNVNLVNAYLQQTHQTQLNCPGGYALVYNRSALNATDIIGCGGLLLLQNYEGAFYAFDLACPYCYAQGNTGTKVKRLEMNEDGLTAVCTNCSSEFGSIMWGSPAPTAGKANEEKKILRQYKATLLSDGYTLVVSR